MRPASAACIVLSLVVIGLIIALSCRSSSRDDGASSSFDEGAEEASSPAFVASPTFAGPRPGYVFKTGDEGVGYYLEESSQQQQQKKRASQSSPLLRRSPPPAVSSGMPPPSSGSGAASAQSSNDVERGQLRPRRVTGVDRTAQAVARRRQSKEFWDDEL